MITTTTRPTTTVDQAEARGIAGAGELVVRPLVDSDAAEWARYVEASPGASLFHHPAWCQTVGRVLGCRPSHLIATRAGETVGLLPLMEIDSLLGGRMLVSVPYGTYGGILCDDTAAAEELGAAAARLTEQRGARVLDMRSAEARVAVFERVEGYLGFSRELPLHPNDVPAFLPKRARAAARQARDRSNVVVRHDSAQLRIVWRLYCRSMRRIASINYPYRFFDELCTRLGSRAWVSVAWLDDRPVAGTVSFVFRDTIMPYVLGADERVTCTGAVNLLYWSVMELAVRAGVRRFDYGRSRADNKGAVGFKKNQGFKPQELGYQRYVPAGAQAPDLKPSNPRYALARRIWQRLPLPVTRVCGAWLARSIPG